MNGPKKITRKKFKLSKEIADEIRRRYREEDINQYELASEYKVNQGFINKIIGNKAWSHEIKTRK